jgi:hypothetical protein
MLADDVSAFMVLMRRDPACRPLSYRADTSDASTGDKSITLKIPPQCIMKERPASRLRRDVAPPPLRYAVQGFAPLWWR